MSGDGLFLVRRGVYPNGNDTVGGFANDDGGTRSEDLIGTDKRGVRPHPPPTGVQTIINRRGRVLGSLEIY